MKSYNKFTNEIEPSQLQIVKGKKNKSATWYEEVKNFFIDFGLTAQMLKCSFTEDCI